MVTVIGVSKRRRMLWDYVRRAISDECPTAAARLAEIPI
jgi:hypothetical protein